MTSIRHPKAALLGLLLLVCASPARAQWDPASGNWRKDVETDIRVMTWNVQDDIRSLATKTEGSNPWTALARIVAAMQPDVLGIQEAGDNGGVDDVSELETTVDLFLHGGLDPFNGGTVTAYVQKYAPGYDLPYVFVSGRHDGFNRNVILSRFPFADLNGDTHALQGDIPTVVADEYAPGGTGGIRGFQFAEIDLPDDTFPADLVVGNAHLKAGGSSSDIAARRAAAQNVAYYVDYLFNGAGTGTPDPNGTIFDFPAAANVLPQRTPAVLMGNWNEDEATNGRKGPAEWLTVAQLAGTPDGTDRDRGDMLFDTAANPFGGSTDTFGSSKLDYIAVQDSIVQTRRAFIFNSGTVPTASLPPEVAGFSIPVAASSLASDHLPLIVDLMPPLPQPPIPAASTWGLLVLALSLCCLATIRLTRRVPRTC